MNVNSTKESESRKTKKEFIGYVVSDKMEKTIVVKVESRRLDPLYKKYVMRSTKVKAHDENNEAKIGDKVKVVESRPISKEKHWKLLEIIEKAK